MAKDGLITRKDIIEDEALNFGEVYASNLKTAIDANNKLVSSVKELNSQVSQFKGAQNSADFLSAKQAQVLATQKVIDATKAQEQAEISLQKIEQERLKTLKQQADLDAKLATGKKTNTQLTIEERVQNEVNNRILKEEAKERLGLVGAYTKLNKQRTDAKKALLDLLSAEEKNNDAIKKAQKEFDELDKKVRLADQAVGDFSKNVGNYPKLTSLTNGIKNLVGAFGLVGGIQLFAGILQDAYKNMKLFEQGIADLSAITGATGKDLEYLKNQAIDLGQETKGGAVAVVEAYKLIASAKPELLSNVQALNQVTEAVLTLSKASGMEMADSAIALTDAMNQFGASADEAQVYIDALANGAKYGSAEIPQLTEAVLKFGAVARSSNVNIKESVALVELLAENGLKGAEAGTALRNVLLKISAPDALPKRAKEELEGLGISLNKLKDSSLPVQERLEMLKPLLKDNASIVNLFGVENATAAINIISHTDRLKDLTSKMGEYGTANEQARIRMNTVQNKTEMMKSTYDSLILSIATGKGVVSGFFGTMIDGITGVLKDLIRLNSSWDELNTKAKSSGQKSGTKIFADQFQNLKGTGSDKDIARSIKESNLRDLKEIEKQMKDTDAKILKAKKESWSLGESFDEVKYKREKERLIKEQAEKRQIIREANKKINPTEAKATAPAVTADLGGGGALSDKEKRAQEKALKDKLDAQRRLSDSLFELKKQELERTIKVNEEIANDTTMTDEVRIQSLKNVQNTGIELANLTKQHSLDQDKFVLEKDKLNANDKVKINEEASNKIIDINAKASKEIKKLQMFDEADYQKVLDNKLSIINTNMNAELEAENKRFLALGDLSKLSERKREKATEEHEKNVFEIKKKYAIQALKLQIVNLETELQANDKLPAELQLSAEKRQKIEETLSKAKLDLTEQENSKSKQTVEQKKIEATQILEISSQLTGALTDLGNSLFDAKIQQIDDEISKNNEYYDKQIELAGDDEKQKDLLQKERDKKNDELEKKKKKEQYKQAVFNKASALAQASISTALAVLNALNSQPFMPMGPIMANLAGVMGAIQIGAILATPIPKYRTGRKGGPAELAIVGDGGVPEVIERKNGQIELTPNKDTLVQLLEGDKVHSSVDAYNKMQKRLLLSSIDTEARNMNSFQMQKAESKYGKELVEEMKLTRRAIERSKTKVNNNIKIDIPHSIWKGKNVNWNN